MIIYQVCVLCWCVVQGEGEDSVVQGGQCGTGRTVWYREDSVVHWVGKGGESVYRGS